MSDCPPIDAVDAKILKKLLINARTSFSEIAKECGLSTNTIRMRFKRLQNQGIITGSITQLNPKKLGYNCIAFLMIRTDANNETNVCEFVQKIPNIISCFHPVGRFCIHCFIASKDVDEFSLIIDGIRAHQHVLEIQQAIWVDVVNMDHPENLIINTSNRILHADELLVEKEDGESSIAHYKVKSLTEKSLEESYELDKIDRSIIRIVAGNAFISFRKIAELLSISTQSVIKRYNGMRHFVLPFSSITVNLQKLGYNFLAVFILKTAYDDTSPDVVENIINLPNILVAIKMVGAFDMLVAAPFTNFNQLMEIKQRICRTPGVNEIELFVNEAFSSWPLNLFAQIVPNI